MLSIANEVDQMGFGRRKSMMAVMRDGFWKKEINDGHDQGQFSRNLQ